MTERKLIWIRPVIVRKDKGLLETGHIYEVVEKEDRPGEGKS